MNSEIFFQHYREGRRDYSKESLSGLDFFIHALLLSHTGFFERELSSLVSEGAEVASKPITGVDLGGGSLKKANVTGSNFFKADLSGANLEEIDGRYACFVGANLSGANLCGADLRFADFSGASLEGANLKDAKLDHSVFSRTNLNNSNIEMIRAAYVDFFNSSMDSSGFINCRFDHSRFSFSNMHGANFVDSTFLRCDLSRVKMIDLVVEGSDFSYVNAKSMFLKSVFIKNTIFSSVGLSGAVIIDGSFIDSVLIDVDFTFAKLHESSFYGVGFRNVLFGGLLVNRVSFYGSSFDSVSFVNSDLSPFFEEEIEHSGQSKVDYMSVAKTVMKNPAHPLEVNPHSLLNDFLISCGMPAVVSMYLIDSIRSLNPEQMVDLMRSTFISYGGPDEEFAKKINADLRRNGVRTFYFPMDAVFGEKLYSTMRRVEDYDRIILVCSERSLDRSGVKYEVEKTLEREARDGGESYLIPISLDKYLFDGWDPARKELKQEITNRVVADFSDSSDYDRQFLRLLYALRKNEEKDA